MPKACFGFTFLLALFLLSLPVAAFDVLEMTPNFATRVTRTTTVVTVTFDEAVDPATVDETSFSIVTFPLGDPVAGGISFTGEDTVVFTPSASWTWGQRYQLVITEDVLSLVGKPFLGSLPFDGVFVANIPNDYSPPNFDPYNPPAFRATYNQASPFLGYNPFDPEGPAEPWQIPGMNVTGAWKYTTGSPDILIALVDTGISHYHDNEFRRNIFINVGELPLPNIEGDPCDEYDCNEDGRFNVEDYRYDDRLGAPGNRDAYQLIQTFSDGFDDDANGFVDDISGWDFLRNVNEALDTAALPLGNHGHWQAREIVSEGNNSVGGYVGACPNCMIIPLRASTGLFYDFGMLAASIRYANAMGASVISHAGANFTWSRQGQQEVIDAYDAGTVAVGVTCDALSFHHWMPYAGEDAIAVKSMIPLPPAHFPDGFEGEDYAFTESWCTGYGSHTMLAVPSGSECTSEAVASLSGLFALLFSYAHEQGIDLEADEAKQILTMTAYDIQDRCFSFIQLSQPCLPGPDATYGYGRPDMEAAMRAVGDVDRGLPSKIPPVVRITAPEWWTTFDPAADDAIDVTGRISARTYPLTWSVQIAPGHQPAEEEFVTVDYGDATSSVEGLITTFQVAEYIDPEWAARPIDGLFAFDATLRVQAAYEALDGALVVGESRKTISVHTDADPDNGLVPGFPLWIGASGESSPLLYDLDGDPDRRMEIIFGTGAGELVVLKFDEGLGTWANLPGFPMDLSGDDPLYRAGIFASVAVGDLFSDSTPEIVAATLGGKVYAIDPNNGGTFLPGFPVSANPVDPSSVLGYGQGNGFMSSPVLADLDLDGVLEIIAGSLDQKMYAWKPAPSPGSATPLPGWPVFCRSDQGLVPRDKVCNGSDIPFAIFGTPAVGILDPRHPDPQISQRLSVLVPTSEECPGGDRDSGRLYAIYHDGMNHPGGPFLPNWPATPLQGSSVLPFFNIIGGISGSPAVWTAGEKTTIAVGAMVWVPQILRYSVDGFEIEHLEGSLSINAAGSPCLSALDPTEDPIYLQPAIGLLQLTPGGLKAIKSVVNGFKLDPPYRKVVRAKYGDLPLLIQPVTGDLDGDGMREIIGGTGDYLVHAHRKNGREIAGWPKYTQKWTLASPAVGDIDADGMVEVVSHTREGYLYAWESLGETCPDGEPNSDWPRFHHDERNTGYHGADTLPPARVTDLTAAETPNGSLLLEFTAPGDDWWCGRASNYTVRLDADGSIDLSDWNSFQAAPGVALTPGPEYGGDSATFEISTVTAQRIALIAVDNEGHRSRISNVAEVAPYVPGDDDDDDDDDDDNNDDNDDDDDDDDTVGDDDDANDDDDDTDDDADNDRADADNGADTANDTGCGC
ncbi:MAG: Ig-like domain-containing protein [Candidatus Lernaella stagnicola]|nr:Ig-like domain-containing protein [Candidatus Lernaella stagnicola]